MVLTLIRTHALLHQASRERDNDGAVVATLDDYAIVRELVHELVSEGVETAVPGTVRQTVEAVAVRLRSDERAHVTVVEVAAALGIDKSAASRRVRAAEHAGYLRNLEDKKGRPARLVLGDALPGDRDILPTVERLHGCTGDDGVTDPPPPDEPPADGSVAGEPRTCPTCGNQLLVSPLMDGWVACRDCDQQWDMSDAAGGAA